MELTKRKTLKEFLIKEELQPQKRLGQHFLVSRQVLAEILKAAELSRDDFVVEIGPGFGSLTLPLAQKAGAVLAIEKDRRVLAALRELAATYSNIEVTAADILTLPKSFFKERALEWMELKGRSSGQHRPAYKVVANLPYYIASNILRLFLENPERPSLLVLMLQREVAEKITAKPGQMSLLSVGVQLFGTPKIVKIISPAAFYPQPKIESAIVKIRTYEKLPWAIERTDKFFKLVRAAFHNKRKQLATTLRENLKLERPLVGQLLGRTNVQPQQRPEELSLKQWEELYLSFLKYL